jgi:ribosomal protein S8
LKHSVIFYFNILKLGTKSFFIINTYFYKNISFFSKLKNISTSSKLITINYRALKLLNIFIQNSVLLLSTNKGIKNMKSCLQSKSGGVLLTLII